MDWQLIQPIFHWLSDHPAWSGLFVFLIALTESLVIVGLIVPGTVLMFGVGTLVGTGVLDVKLVLFLAFAGAVLGDGLSFWFGAHYRDQISGFWPFKNNPQMLDKGKHFFNRHGGKSVFFGRFVGPVRPVIPAIAGMMHMPAKTFFTINVISAAAWAPFYLIPGILFGSSIGLASAIGSRLVIVLLSVVVGAALLLFIVKKAMNFTMPKLEGWFDRLIKWSGKHTVVGGVVGILVDPNEDTKSALRYALFSSFFVVIFFAVFVLSFWSSWLLQVDTIVKNLFVVLRSAPADNLMWLIQNAFSWLVLLLALLNVWANLYYSGFKKAFGYFSVLILSTLISSLVVIYVYSFSKNEIVDALAYLHLSLLVSGLLFYAVMASENRPLRYRWPYYALTILIVFSVSFTDVYFAILTLSQMFIAVSLSVVWVLILSLAYRRHTHCIKSFSFISNSTVLIVFLVTILMAVNHAHRDEFLVKIISAQEVSTEQWRENQWQELSVNRSDVFGKQKNSLNLQWQGNLSEIKKTLVDAGWQPSKQVSFRSLLYWLAPEPELEQIIRLPQTNNGATESLLYIKTEGDRQFVLQLWSSSLKNLKGVPVWLGAVSVQKLVVGERWLSFFKVERNAIAELLENERIAEKWRFSIKKRKTTEYKDDFFYVLLVYKE